MTGNEGSLARPCTHGTGDEVLMAVFDNYRIGILADAGPVDVSHCFDSWSPHADAIPRCIAEWPRCKQAVREAVSSGTPVDVGKVVLRPPVPRPRNLLCAPVNYHSHRGEVKMDRTGEAGASADVRQRGFFLKSPSSIVGPDDAIELPNLEGREFSYEGEIAFILGKSARAVDAERAWDYVFGLTGFIDATLRPSKTQTEERSMRKSYYSFGPLGPWILLTDEAPDTSKVSLSLYVNGELRQQAVLSDLIQTIPDLLATGSHVIPLMPGDVFATGTPSGVGPIVPGDVVTLHVCPIGEMSVNVVKRSW